MVLFSDAPVVRRRAAHAVTLSRTKAQTKQPGGRQHATLCQRHSRPKAAILASVRELRTCVRCARK